MNFVYVECFLQFFFLYIADHVVLRSPHPDRITTIITTPHTSPRHLSPVREDGWEGRKEGGTQQDSILHDSGFLPGTPPAKKAIHSPHTYKHTLIHNGIYPGKCDTVTMGGRSTSERSGR